MYRIREVRRAAGVVMATAGLCMSWSSFARAETMQSALVQAYQGNPQLNAQRANARVIDENVPQALSGYRPHVSVAASYGGEYESLVARQTLPGVATLQGSFTPEAVGITAQQTLFNGFQTANRTRAAESQVSAAREALRIMEQTVLLAAATAYMDVLRDTAILAVQRANVRVLQEMLDLTRRSYDIREVTQTDVFQAEAQLAGGQSGVSAAESALTTSRANYRQIVGSAPVNLAPASPVDKFSARTLAGAIELAVAENPNVTAAMYGVDVAHLQVKINEGALFPNLVLQASAQERRNPDIDTVQDFAAAVIGQLTIPIYQGGGEYSLIRQSKESLGQQRLTLDLVRNQARQAVTQAWGQVEAAKAEIASAKSQVASSEAAVRGVRDEARIGQRTTYDVLVAQQSLVNARVALIVAQHDRVVASYSVLSAIGRLSPQVLGLTTPIYDPRIHYHQIRDAWTGIRTPDGR